MISLLDRVNVCLSSSFALFSIYTLSCRPRHSPYSCAWWDVVTARPSSKNGTSWLGVCSNPQQTGAARSATFRSVLFTASIMMIDTYFAFYLTDIYHLKRKMQSASFTASACTYCNVTRWRCSAVVGEISYHKFCKLLCFGEPHTPSWLT